VTAAWIAGSVRARALLDRRLGPVRVFAAEIAATARRVHALRRRWIPMLTTELARVELALDEQDRAESIGHRLAAAGRNDARPEVG